jgi:hypothetical protein
MLKNVYRPSCKVPWFLSDFNQTSIFWTDFQKHAQIPNFMKIRPVGAELFHADGRTGGQTYMTNVLCFLLGDSPASVVYPERNTQHSEHGKRFKSTIHDEANSRFSQFWERALKKFKIYRNSYK